MSQAGNWDLRPGFSLGVVKGDFDRFFEPPSFAEDLLTGVGSFRGETRFLALDLAEDRDLLEFALVNGF